MPEPWKCQISPLRGVSRQHPLDDLVGALILLVAADDLQAALLFVGGEEGEVGQDVEEDVRAEEGFGGLANLT